VRRGAGGSAAVEAALVRFAAAFVARGYRDRVVHDALRRPERLGGLIAHRIEAVLAVRWLEPGAGPADGAVGWLWRGARFDRHERPVTLAEARSWSHGAGGGLLFVEVSGAAFYAETEGHPPRVYGGVAHGERA
jgi:hypothetical protein